MVLPAPFGPDERHDVTLPDPEAGVAEQQPPVRQVVVEVRDLECPMRAMMADAREAGQISYGPVTA